MSPVRLGPPRMTPQAFSAKWADNALKESAASKEHFLDVCALVGSPTPREADGEGEWFAFRWASSWHGASHPDDVRDDGRQERVGFQVLQRTQIALAIL